MAALVLSGCGGSSTTPSSASSFSGTTAIGLGLEAQIQILDVPTCQTLNVVSDSTGYFQSGDITHTTGPYILRATSSLGFNMYSYIDVTQGDVVNITPLTHYATDAASRASAGVSIASLYGSCSNGITNFDDFQTELPTQTDTLINIIENNFNGNEYASLNPFSTSFQANQTGYDALLDRMDMSFNNNDTFIRIGDSILETSDEDITSESTLNITITGNVYDSNGSYLDGVNVAITLRNENIDFTPITLTTDRTSFSAALEQYRDYVITYSKAGYQSVTQNFNTFNSNTTTSDVTLYTIDEIAAMTEITPSINIINSRNGDTISDVTINIREGFNNRLGTIYKTYESSSASGLTLLPGTYTFELTKEGFYSDFVTTTISSSTSILNFDLLSIATSTTINSDAFATIIVRWGLNPEDLDSHLLFSGNDVYYSNPWNGTKPTDVNNPCDTNGVVASLDLDDTTSYGPETTTICDGTKGPFNFKIHHYSGSSNIGASPTTVELITRDGSRYEFTAPTDTQYTGTDNDYWDVFSLNTDQSVTAINTIGNASTSIADFNNKTYRITDSEDNSYVVFTLNSDGTSSEVGYLSDGSVEFNKTSTWNYSYNSIYLTYSDNRVEYHNFPFGISNNAIVNVEASDGDSVTGTISNYNDL
jgi:hypothetical protein